MKGLLLLVVLLLVLAAIAAVRWQTSETNWAGRTWLRRRSGDAERAPRPRCLPCHGTGRLGPGLERTMTFVGDGFEDRPTPTTLCSACGGTGTAPGR
jgi:hypothetical protein